MQKLSVILLGIAGLFLTFAASCSFDAEESSYAEDRALIEDLQALRARTQAYERKYGVTSHHFYSLYQQGLLDDEGFEQSTEFVRWASAYEMQIDREAEFEARSHSFVSRLKQTTSEPAIQLRPNPELVRA